MIEFEVPVIVRHAIRCARIFFFGLVDFEKLDLYHGKELDRTLAKINDQNEQHDQIESKSSLIGDHNGQLDGDLGNCC